tara:strand:- start:87 stop:476 length:390 start_codon:yes stop_codon:yes gene_type:complete
MAIGRESLVKSAHETTTKEEQLLNAPYGQQGAVVITMENTAWAVGDFYCIMALRDDVVLQADLTEVNWELLSGSAAVSTSPYPGGSPGGDIPLPVGLPLYGDFKVIQLKDQSAIQGHCATCPKLIAYRR